MKRLNESVITIVSLASTIFFFILVVCASAQVTEAWMVQHDGLKRLRSDTHPVGFAVDTTGNAYVTGYSVGSYTSDDYATVKYDANGNEIWVARYNGPYNEWDCPTALAVDVAGNVYVTGLSYNQGTLINDYATIKYDTSGNQLWVARYNGPGNGNDEAMAIAVDGAGNVYVAGAITGMNSGYDFATIKLVPNITDDGGGGDSNNGGGGSGGGGGGGGCFLNAITN